MILNYGLEHLFVPIELQNNREILFPLYSLCFSVEQDFLNDQQVHENNHQNQ